MVREGEIMKIIKWMDEYIEEVFLVVLSTIMVTFIFLQVVLRQFGNSLSWSEELARFSFVWLVYIGISYGVKKQRHVKIDIVLQFLKDKQRVILTMIANFLFLGFAILVVIKGYSIADTLLSYGQKSPALHIPMGLVYLATPVGMGLTTIRLIQNIILNFKSLFGFSNDDGVKLEYEKVLENQDEIEFSDEIESRDELETRDE